MCVISQTLVGPLPSYKYPGLMPCFLAHPHIQPQDSPLPLSLSLGDSLPTYHIKSQKHKSVNGAYVKPIFKKGESISSHLSDPSSALCKRWLCFPLYKTRPVLDPPTVQPVPFDITTVSCHGYPAKASDPLLEIQC